MVCSAAGCPQSLQSGGRRRSKNFRFTSRHLVELGRILGGVLTGDSTKPLSTPGSVPSALWLPVIFTLHHSSAPERAKVPQIQARLYIPGLEAQGVQEAPAVPWPQGYQLLRSSLGALVSLGCQGRPVRRRQDSHQLQGEAV